MKITRGTSLDVLEIDGASNRGIDQIRELKERIKFSPVESRYKIYIIDEVHMLTNEAFNALLKTLEEPPSHVIFIFATTDPQKLPQTILSRCQRFDFKILSVEIIEEELKKILKMEGVTFDEESLTLISQRADGSMRDALSILEQIVSYTNGHISKDKVLEILGIADTDTLYSILKDLKTDNRTNVLSLLERLLSRGVDIQFLYRDLIKMLRDALFYNIGGSVLVGDSNKTYIRQIQHLGKIYTEDELRSLLDKFIFYETHIRTTSVPRILLEFLLFFGTSNLKEDKVSEKVTVDSQLIIYDNDENKADKEQNKLDKSKDIDKVRKKKEEYNEEPTISIKEIDDKILWDKILSNLGNKALENSLRDNVKSYKLDGKKLILTVPEDMVFYLEEKKSLLKKAVKKVLNWDISVAFEQVNVSLEDNHFLLKQGLNIFGGRIINLNENGQEV